MPIDEIVMPFATIVVLGIIVTFWPGPKIVGRFYIKVSAGILPMIVNTLKSELA